MSVLSLARFKRCPKCGCTKPATADFYSRNRSAPDGFQRRCKVCARCAKRGWIAANYEAVLEANRRQYWTHRDRRLEAVSRYRAENPAVMRARDLRRRVLLLAAEGTHTAAEIDQMIADQDGLCAYCETPLTDDYHVEHMVPLSRGGRNDWTNLAIACPLCNRSKGTKTVEEFMENGQANTEEAVKRIWRRKIK